MSILLDLIRDTIGSSQYQYLETKIATLGDSTAAFNCVMSAVKANNPSNAATLYQANINAYKTGLTELKAQFALIP